ncbi:hypothetical protein VTO42DRAFT_269 [Malbranchea cinnamomea]
MGISPTTDQITSQHNRRNSQLAASHLPTVSGANPSEDCPLFRDDTASDAGGEGKEEEEEEEEAKQQTTADGYSDRTSIDTDPFEMDYINSDDNLNDDEESGLTAHERRKKLHMRRRYLRDLDSRTVDVRITVSGRRTADLNVIKKLAINTVFILLWYIFSLSISVYNKWMFSPTHLNFPYPLFTTSLHMVVQFTLSSIILYFIPSLRPRHPGSQFSNGAPRQNAKPVVTKTFYLTRLVPCGSATSLDIGLGNMSLRFITLSFLTMCKSSALGFVLLFAFLFRLETPSVKLIMIICAMIVGVVMMVAGEPNFNALGFSLIIASSFFSGFRWGLTQILLLRHPATSNPFSTLFLLTPIMFVSLIIISFLIEHPSEILSGLATLAAENGPVKGILLLIFPGTLAFCMIASEFALLRRSSVVTLSICGIFKEVITIIAGGSVFDDKLTPINVVGLVITMASIATYNYLKVAKMRKDARKDVAITTAPLNNDSDSDQENQPPMDNSRPGLFDRLGETFGRSSSNKGTVGYQPVHGPMRPPLGSRVDPGDDAVPASPVFEGRGRPAIRARVMGPGGPSSATTSGTLSDAESNNRRKEKKPRSAARGVLASDYSHAAENSSVRERSLSRTRRSPSLARPATSSPQLRN